MELFFKELKHYLNIKTFV
ncbi:MAG: hypothetical protein ABIJ37_02340 [Pseudomonadota bacterium]